MTGDDCAVARQDLAVYLFGALSPAERAGVDRHLGSCRRCRKELALLAGLPALLGKVPAGQAARVCADQAAEEQPDHHAVDGLLKMMLIETARARRRRRWRLTAAAAALIAAASAGWGLQVLSHAGRSVSRQWAATAAGFDPKTRAEAWVRYAARAWGTVLEVHVTGIPAGTTCQFWVTGSRGHSVEAGGWAIAPGQQDTWFSASASVPVAGLRSFEVTSAGKTLVTVRAHPAAAAVRHEVTASGAAAPAPSSSSSAGGKGYGY